MLPRQRWELMWRSIRLRRITISLFCCRAASLSTHLLCYSSDTRARYTGCAARCCSMLRDATQAEDAAQESWVRVSTALASYDRRASLSTWIYAITRNRCLTAIERRRYLVSMSTADIEAE